MKRYFYYLLFVMPFMLMASCDDDNDLPPVSVTLDVSGVTVVDDEVYVVREDGFTVDAVTLDNRGDKKAMIGAASYFWDGWHVGTSAESPFAFEFVLSDTEIGAHLLQVECSVYAVDYAPAVAQVSYKINVVESADDIPGGANPTTMQLDTKISTTD